ncbi:hypothetical protein FRC12_000576 [Ceratobasidium sp. 428]|nr:hypothetical protein FRC12_000576 [Ceratobasidium sp. 428]
MATKTLNFDPSDLPIDMTVAFVFQLSDTSQQSQKQCPVVWKVLKFSGRGDQGKATVQYNPRFAYGPTQHSDGDTVAPTGLTEVSGKAQGKDILLSCKNNSSNRADLAIGFAKGNGQQLEPTLVWKDVDPSTSVTTQFTPVLRAYAIGQYQEHQILRSEVQAPVIWQQDLSSLDDTSEWKIGMNPATGEITIRPA